MSVLKSQINPRAAEFRANAERIRGLVSDLKQEIEAVSQGGDAAARDKHIARGKMLPRGFCALPCAKIEQGLTPTRPGFPARDRDTTDKLLKKPPPPRCPPPFKCRSKGGDISIDLCVRE